MSITVVSTTDAKAPAPSESTDKGASQSTEVEKTSSEETQGESDKEQNESTAEATTNSDEEVDGEGDGDSDGETKENAEKPKKKSGIQRLKERHAREMAEVRRELEALRTQAKDGKPEALEAVKGEESPKPRAEDFETHEEYVEALTDWKLEQRERAREAKAREDQAKQAYQSQIQKHNERVEKFRAETPEFDQVIEDFVEEHGDVKLSPGLQQAIFESEVGPAVMMELAKDFKEFQRVNSLSVIGAAREIGKIEARLARESTKKETKTTTKAPPPPNPVSGKSDKALKKSIYDPNLTQTEYERLRREMR